MYSIYAQLKTNTKCLVLDRDIYGQVKTTYSDGYFLVLLF